MVLRLARALGDRWGLLFAATLGGVVWAVGLLPALSAAEVGVAAWLARAGLDLLLSLGVARVTPAPLPLPDPGPAPSAGVAPAPSPGSDPVVVPESGSDPVVVPGLGSDSVVAPGLGSDSVVAPELVEVGPEAGLATSTGIPRSMLGVAGRAFPHLTGPFAIAVVASAGAVSVNLATEFRGSVLAWAAVVAFAVAAGWLARVAGRRRSTADVGTDGPSREVISRTTTTTATETREVIIRSRDGS